MKTPEEYLETVDVLSLESALQLIKQVQIDAVEHTVERCAEEAEVEVIDHEELHIDSLVPSNDVIKILPIYGTNIESILNVANKIKKEL